MSKATSLRYEPENLETFVNSILKEAGLASPHREIIAEALVHANLRGVDSPGVAQLKPYIEHLEAGGFNPNPDIKLVKLAASALVVDADDGPGQSAGNLRWSD